mmetsp:Transcript_33297/g.72680  ORF Transcript_33297/g.72680 Transcript_33297/m.72680 type:complete len:268 (+) Transcript_33297:58-861(+)|eukprot:CAMPEP_0170608380 /NCGR_PEP_ID=MMETSP0224-20130122/21554_1 /TAXON_ID=285029 /ORGANISM="Togula jolla, Strain CCCM 725" /LENGTH=267 /DNA_ID=CAMNT_0010933603 /DNA_START=57 /DNA_END=860 /DNA_ORIENTATION=+
MAELGSCCGSSMATTATISGRWADVYEEEPELMWPEVQESPAVEAWRPNIHAQEFIPTMSLACPLVGVCTLVPEDEAGNFAVVMECTSLGLGLLGNEAPGAGICTTSASKPRKEARYPGAKMPSQAKGGTQMPQIERSVLELPEASEEEWQHRAAMRRKAVRLGKETREYLCISELKRSQGEEEAADDEPSTPDYRDRSLSKRQWKWQLLQWRNALKRRYLEEGHGSVASTEECSSLACYSTLTGCTEMSMVTVTDGDEDSLLEIVP